MEQVICLTRSERFRELLEGLEGCEILPVDTSEALALGLVETTDVACALIHLKTKDEFWAGFLSSMRACFPLLHSIVVVEQGDAPPGRFSAVFKGDPTGPEAFAGIAETIRSFAGKDARRHHRFDWPLRGTLRIGDREGHYRVRAISAGGAFLETPGESPAPGSMGTLSVEFQDFSILSGCEALSPRGPAGGLPSGFGVRFTDLTEGSRKVVDRIVADELLRRLLEPESRPQLPSISA